MQLSDELIRDFHMSLTPSNMMPLGTTAPDFTLPDTVSGTELSLSQLKGLNGTLIIFMCNHCPFVIHIEDELVKLAKDYPNNSLSIVAISANNIDTHPQDGPDQMKTKAEKLGFGFPYLYDESQDTAKAYGAACTPDLFLFDADLKCVYRGQFDDSRPGNNLPVNGKDIREAIDALLNGTPINPQQTPSIGCNIKWK